MNITTKCYNDSLIFISNYKKKRTCLEVATERDMRLDSDT